MSAGSLPPEQITRWVKEYDTPIRKLGSGDAGFAVDVRSLLIWMDSLGIQRGDYTPPRVPIVIRHEGQPPEYLR